MYSRKYISQRFLRILVVMAIITATGCVSNKKYTLLQDAAKYKLDTTLNTQNKLYLLKPGDHVKLEVRFLVPEHPLKPLFEDASGGGQRQMQGGGGNDLYFLSGYGVDKEGNIELPYFGKVKASGKDVYDLQDELQKLLNEKTSNVYVQVRYAGVRFTILGEVNSQGKYSVLQDRVNILEAVAMAGGFNQIAKRDSVVLVREYPEGRKTHIMNLLRTDIINSPYYYLNPHDVIFVKPLPQRQWGTGVEGVNTFNTIFGIITSGLVLFSIFGN